MSIHGTFVEVDDLLHEPGSGLTAGDIEGEQKDDPPEVTDTPVDPPEQARSIPEKVADAVSGQREPIIPAWAKTRAGVAAVGRNAAGAAWHTACYHTVRAPWYLTKVVVLAPVGALKLARDGRRFIADTENKAMRQRVAAGNDPTIHLRLVRERNATVGRRLGWAVVLGVVLTVAYVVAWWLLPPWVLQATWATVLALLARHGAPDEHPLVGSVVVRRGPPRLTSFSVARALAGVGIPELANGFKRKETAEWFPQQFARTAVGHEVVVELPYGVTAAEVMEKRAKLAAGLRRPIGAVWPGGDVRNHPGWLVMHVLDAPMSEMKQPPWPLARSGKSDMFKPLLLGWDQRGMSVRVPLMFSNLLVGAIPRQGKSWTVRVITLAAAFDVTCELHLHELKGTNDYAGLRSSAHRFTTGSGSTDRPAIESVMASLREVHGYLDTRAKTIARLGAQRCPEAKVTRELSSDPTLRLHPVLWVLDEAHEVFENEEYKDEAEQLLRAIIKRGPALGVMLVLATQRPDAKALPTSITTNMGHRLCLRVGDAAANNVVLGNGAYKMGMNATLFTDDDLGVALLRTGGTSATTVRAALLDGRDADRIGARAHAMRLAADRLTGDAVGRKLERDADRLIVVQDAIEAWYDADGDDPSATVPGGPSAWLHRLEEAMAGRAPGRYGDLEPGWLGPRLRAARVATMDGRNRRVDGDQVNRAGVTLEALRKALEGVDQP